MVALEVNTKDIEVAEMVVDLSGKHGSDSFTKYMSLRPYTAGQIVCKPHAALKSLTQRRDGV